MENQRNPHIKRIPWVATKHPSPVIIGDSMDGNLTNNVQDIELPYISGLPGSSSDNSIPTEILTSSIVPRSLLRDIWASPLPQIEDISHKPKTETLGGTSSSVANGSAEGPDIPSNTNNGHNISAVAQTNDLDAINSYGIGQYQSSVTNHVSIPSNRLLLAPRQDKGSVLVNAEEHITCERDTKPSGPISKVWNVPRRTRNRKRRSNDHENVTPHLDQGSQTGRRGARSGNQPRLRGAFTDDALRGMTAWTRELKSCIRCRMQRNRCRPDDGNPSGPCLTCLELSSRKISQLPCLRWIITDACIYREQSAPYQGFTKRWQSMDIVDIQDWASDEVKTIHVSQAFLNAPYTIEVREFIPQEGDLIEEKWTVDGEIKRHQVPRYALVNMEKHAEDLLSFINKNVGLYIIGAVDKEDDLIWQTYYTAFKHANGAKTVEERVVLLNLFRLWVALYKTSNIHHICGDDKLGCEPITDPQSPWFNLVPIPAVIIAQKECIIYTKIFQPLSKKILRDLQHLVLSNKRQYWLTIYLTIFILMHSCAMITRRDEETARQYNLKERFANPIGISAHHIAAQIMLAHFNYINSGFRPFQIVLEPFGPEKLKEAGHLTDEQAEFVRSTALWVRNNDGLLQKIREDNNSGHTYYWISQIYQEIWKPGPIG
ncbi:uncharacterized protein F4807DRAFT_448916 [Annulohypoxylon truncatum]|uniref:uncharacterized protein n=1 Tax=Annulohypoxylon truncatum TaxID=327061 RepID=UPI0020080B8B|nr:uncharacterized protein F4807DRAFT_448916 [Annulohypoxylon truncatum]KAI1204113.1 hypothetical protein F4807DRAFT_448916 [Annulohypoxylon truncatum]